MKIVITGVAGAIGSHLAERFLSLGHEVVGIDALRGYYDPDIKMVNARDVEQAGGKMYYLDLVTDDFKHVLEGAEIIFHCAAQPGISATTPFQTYLDDNIVATHRLLEATKHLSSLKAFIHASTSSVYGARATGDETTEPKPTSNYGVTKLAAEQLALSYYRSFSLPVINLRFFSVYGERERPEKFFHKLIKAMYENKEINLYDGSDKHVRSYSYIGDIIDGCMSILEKHTDVIGETFNLGNDKTNTTGEGLRLIEELMGKKAQIKVVPKRTGDQIETAADITKATTLLGYNPQTDLKTGLAKEVEWYGQFIHGKF